MTQYYFNPMTWKDDEDGGSVGDFYGTQVRLEGGGGLWVIVVGNEQYGYQRGGRDGERTLDDIKRIAENDAQGRAQSAYESALNTVATFEGRHLLTETAA